MHILKDSGVWTKPFGDYWYTSSLKFGNGKCDGIFKIPIFRRIDGFRNQEIPDYKEIGCFSILEHVFLEISRYPNLNSFLEDY